MAPVRFAILAAPRTGSNCLCSLLQSHPDILSHHEVFNPAGTFYALPLRRSGFSLGSLQARERDPVAFLSRVWAQDLGHRAVGLKMTHRQHPRVLEALCADPGVRKILLRRQGRIRTFVSRLIAERSGVWEDYGPPAAPPRPVRPVVLDVRQLMEALAADEVFYRELEEQSVGATIGVQYEELFDAACQRRLLAFLGVPHRRLRSASRRQNPYPLRALIANYEEVARELEQSGGAAGLYSELTAAGP